MKANIPDKIVIQDDNGNHNRSIVLDYAVLRKAVINLRAVNHKIRRQILKLLEEKNKLSVTEIYQKMKLDQSVASQHLAALRKAGVVKTERDGKFIYYMIDENRVEEISNLINDLAS